MPPIARRASGAMIVLGCLLLALALVLTASAASPNGDLTPVGCVDLLAVACEGGPTLDDLADALVPSPDGSDLYAVIDGRSAT